MSKQTKENRTVISRKKVPAGVLEQVSKNVFVMDIDFSEPTGEDYFKTSAEYDKLPEEVESVAK